MKESINTIGKHVCTLPQEPPCGAVPPTAARWRRLACRLRHLTLACAWHRGAAAALRSRASLAADRAAQLAGGALLHPYSPLFFGWQCCVAALWAFTLFYVPLVAFIRGGSIRDPFILFTNITALLDVLINFRTGYEDDDSKRIIMNPVKIAKYYATRTFLLDLTSAIPSSWIIPILTENFSRERMRNHKFAVKACFYVTKALRFLTLHRYWAVVRKQLQLSYATVIISTCVVQTLYFLHWMTFIYFQLPIFMAYARDQDIPNNSWLNIRHVDLQNQSGLAIYSTSLYYVTALAIGAGYYYPVDEVHLVDEMLLTSFISIVGLVFFSYTLMALLRLGMYANYQVYTCNAKRKELEQFMKNLRLPDYLQKKVLLHVHYKYEGDYFNEEYIMNTLSQQMKQEIHLFCCSRLLDNSSFFSDTPKAFLRNIICNLQLAVYLPGEYLMKRGQLAESMYFISRGTVAVTNYSGREVAHLIAGAHFGEAALLLPGRQTSIDVAALELCEVYRLDANDFQYCLMPYPALRRELEERVSRKMAGNARTSFQTDETRRDKNT